MVSTSFNLPTGEVLQADIFFGGEDYALVSGELFEPKGTLRLPLCRKQNTWEIDLPNDSNMKRLIACFRSKNRIGRYTYKDASSGTLLKVIKLHIIPALEDHLDLFESSLRQIEEPNE